ncbi:MAG: hypothetical protein JXB35_04730, partial [Anaerolineae bacterium]|nr:hypothetical protein [Anaerolineae bacterium]
TRDDGESWQVIYPTFPLTQTMGVVGLAVDPAHRTQPALFVARNDPSGTATLERSIDTGASWQTVFSAPGTQLSDIAAVRDAMGNLVVFAVGEDEVWRSTDGGDTWTLSVAGLPAWVDLFHVMPSPTFASDHTVYLTGFNPLLRSTDGGLTWSVVTIPWVDIARHVVFSPDYAVDGTLWVSYFWIEGSGDPALPPNGVVRSTDYGATWAAVNTGLPVDYLDGWIMGLAVAPEYVEAPELYAVERTVGAAGTTWELFRSLGGGAGWRRQGTTPGTPRGLLMPRPGLLLLPTDGGLWRLTCTCWEYLLNGACEGDLGWELPATAIPAAYSFDEAHGGSRAIRLGLVEGPNVYGYSSARQRITLPNTLVTATLEVWLFPLSDAGVAGFEKPAPAVIPSHRLAAGPWAGDAQYVLLMDDQGAILERLLWMLSNEGTWGKHTFDVSAYRGESIWVHFGVYNDGAGAKTGLYVDDVSMQGCGSDLSPPPVPPDGLNPGAVGQDFLLTDADDAQRNPALAFNPEDETYLLVWEDSRQNYSPDIFVQRVSAGGRLLGKALALTDDDVAQSNPSVAYLPAADRYLVIWEDRRAVVDAPDVYGQLITREGAPDGTPFPIAAYLKSQVHPDVAAGRDEFLVVWGNATGLTSTILGQRVNGTGVLLGPAFDLIDTATWAGTPALAYNPTRGHYVVIWRDARLGYENIYGQIVLSDGTLQGSNFAISTEPVYQEVPDVAIGPGQGLGLVVWGDRRTGELHIYGHYLNVDGTPLAGDFRLSDLPLHEAEPVPVGWGDPLADEFLVVWQATEGRGDLVARRVMLGGIGALAVINDDAYTQSRPAAAVASSAADPSYLVVWEDYRLGTHSGIYGQRLDRQGERLALHAGLTPLPQLQVRPALAYSTLSDGYLVAWADVVGGGGNTSTHVKAYWLAGEGVLTRHPLTLTEQLLSTDSPVDVAWDFFHDRFLVIWRDPDLSQTPIVGQLVAAEGSLVGANAILTGITGDKAALAVEAGMEHYLIVFQNTDVVSGTTDIYGQLVDANAAPLSAAFNISQAPCCGHAAWNPHLAYDPVNNTYLVVWQDDRDGLGLSRWDVRGQLVAAEDGALLGTAHVIAGDLGHNEHLAQVVRGGSEVEPRFLVVWEDVDMTADGDPDVMARRVRLDGAPDGIAYPIATASHWEGAPAISHDVDSGRYLVAWYDGEQGDPFLPGISARQLSPAGLPETDSLTIVHDTYSARFEPEIAARHVASSPDHPATWLVIWEDHRADLGVTHINLYGRWQAVIYGCYLPLILR